MHYCAQMLEHKPNNYKALEQLILLVRRAGRLHETAAKGGDALRFLKVLTLLALVRERACVHGCARGRVRAGIVGTGRQPGSLVAERKKDR